MQPLKEQLQQQLSQQFSKINSSLEKTFLDVLGKAAKKSIYGDNINPDAFLNEISKLIGGGGGIAIPNIDLTPYYSAIDKFIEQYVDSRLDFSVSPEPKKADVQFLIDWKADSVIPKSYQGKALPGPSTKVTISFNILEKGKLVDVSNQKIFWYLDDNLVKNGIGAQSFSFYTFIRGGTFHKVRIMIDNYNNRNEIAIQTVRIPVVFPKVVLEAPFPNHVFSTQKIRIPAKLFYFNKGDVPLIRLSWEVNQNQTSAPELKDQLFLDLNLEGARRTQEFNIAVEARNLSDVIQTAISQTSLTYQP